MGNRVLFVDDDPLVLHAYEGLARSLGVDFSVHTAQNGEEALKLIEEEPFDVLVTDLIGAEAGGAHFLIAAVRAQPDCVRIVVSGAFEATKIASSLFYGHRYFDKPCDLKELATLLRRLAAFRQKLGNNRVRSVIGGLGSLPGPPEAFLKLDKAIASPSCSIEEIATIVEQHPAITAKLLQIVNSAQFGLSQRVVGVAHAINFVGLNLLRVVVLATHAVMLYQERSGKNRRVLQIWDHSSRVASAARDIARRQGFSSESCERAFLAGLLHDIGRIVVAAHAPEEFDAVQAIARNVDLPIESCEIERCGATYADISAYILALWGIGDEVTAIVEHQNRLLDFDGNDVNALAAFHVAHCMVENNSANYPLDTEALAEFGFTDPEGWVSKSVPAL